MDWTFVILAVMLTPTAIRLMKDEERKSHYPPRKKSGREFI